MGGAFKFERAKLALAAGLFALALLIGAPLIHAQQPGPVINGAGTYGPPVATSNGHVQWGNGAPPTISTSGAECGNNIGIVSGTDASFHFVTGTSGSTNCTAIFAVPYAKRPTCVASGETATSVGVFVTTSHVRLTSVGDATRYYVHCIAQPGGL